MALPDLIYCAAGNARFAKIAIDAGFLYGAQMPNTVYYPPHFVDQNWREPDLDKYATAVAEHRPKIASVLDWEQPEQLPEMLRWAETIAPFVDTIMIIPKILGGIAQLPRQIGGKPIRLGYSVPTKFGGTCVPYSEFYGWPVHLLGGNPHRQRRLSTFMDVVSLDGNYAQMMAVRYNEFWYKSQWHELSAHGGKVKKDAPYVAFERSCHNIMAMWQGGRQSLFDGAKANEQLMMAI